MLQIGHQTRNVDELRHGPPLFGLLVDYDGRAYAAVRVAATGERAPLGLRAMHHVCDIRESADERDGEPVARRRDLADLLAYVLCHVRQRVSLLQPPLR